MEKQAVNPFLPSYEYIPDGEAYVFNNRVYIFGSHDQFNGKKFCMNDYVTWSADVNHLSDWKFEGVIYNRFKDPMITEQNQFVYAPDVQLGIDGRYYLYYFFGFNSILSVAVCDTPSGEFQFYGYVKYPNGTFLGHESGDPLIFDPGILVDEGRVYLYVGFSPRFITSLAIKNKCKLDGSYVIELEKDMVTVKTSPKLVIPSIKKSKGTGFEHHEFFEASSIRKYKDMLYFVYSSDHNHELCYATSHHATGPFTYGGVLISNADIGYNNRKEKDALTYHGNNHGGMIQIKDRWYILYHRHTNGHSYSRQTCAEEIHINQDGSIDQVEMTSCGFNQGPLEGKGTYSSHIACNLMSKHGAGSYSPLLFYKSYRKHPYLTQKGVDREDNPNQYIANVKNGTVIGYKYFLFDHLNKMSVQVWGKAKGEFQIFTSFDERPIGIIPILLENNQNTFISDIRPISGKYPLYFRYVGKGTLNFESFRLY